MKILVLGSRGMVGSSVSRVLKNNKDINLFESSRDDTNLFSLTETKKLLNDFKPNIIINSAAKVGGILANDLQRTDFILNNLKININIIESLIKFPEIKLINLGSSCIYPLGAEVPITESSLLTGKLEPTNSAYAMAKLAAIEMGDAISKQYGHEVIDLMPTNLYGPNDNYNLLTSHFFPALIKKIIDAIKNNKDYIVLWGNGKSRRELIFSEDIASACIFFLRKKTKSKIFNIGSGMEYSIEQYAKLIMKHLKVNLRIIYDSKRPNGTFKKLLDSSLAKNNGWSHQISFKKGLPIVINDYLRNHLDKINRKI